MPRAFAALPIDTALRFEGLCLERKEAWLWNIDSEDFAEAWREAAEDFDPFNDRDPARAFCLVLLGVDRMLQDIRSAIDAAILGVPTLGIALVLGERIDQGIRPSRARDHVFRRRSNELKRSQRRHAGDYRLAVGRYRRALASFCRGRSALLNSAEREARPTPPPIPEKESIGPWACEVGSIPPPHRWAGSVAALWAQAQLPTHLPGALFALDRRPESPAITRLVMLIDREARMGFAALAEHPAGESNASRAEGDQNDGEVAHGPSLPGVVTGGTGVDLLGANGRTAGPRALPQRAREHGVPIAEANLMVREFVRTRPTASIRETMEGTGLPSTSSVHRTTAWKVHRAKKMRKEGVSAKTFRLTSRMIACIKDKKVGQEPSVGDLEDIERAFFDHATDEELDWYASEGNDRRDEVLLTWLDQRHELAIDASEDDWDSEES